VAGSMRGLYQTAVTARCWSGRGPRMGSTTRASRIAWGDMAISIKTSDASDELKYWTGVDLWSDGQRYPVLYEAPAQALTPGEGLRNALVGADDPLPLTADTVTDGELRQYLSSPAMSRWSYHLLRLACSFKKGTGERFARADLNVNLKAQDGELESAVAWSMSPLALLDGDERTDTLTVGAGLKFVNAEVSRQAKASQGTLLRAYDLLTASPSWRFTATRIGELEGIFQLGLVVRSPSGVGFNGTVYLDVVVEQQRRLGRNRSAKIKGASSLKVETQSAD